MYVDNNKKIVRLSQLLETLPVGFSQEDATLCYGSFNVIHPGHLRHFQQARTHGKRLHVAIEGDRFLTKHQLGHQFGEHDRALAVATLGVVDCVILLDSGPLLNLVQAYPPAALTLGKEFERERSEEVLGAVEYMSAKKLRVIYEAGAVQYASVEMFHRNQTDLEIQKLDKFREILQNNEIDVSRILGKLKQSRVKILVVGDTIVDQYVACDALGMSSEAPVIVARELETQEYLGGAAVVASHLQSLGVDCNYLSVVGADATAELVQTKLKEKKIKSHLVVDPDRPTTFKIRYMVENQKLFRVSRVKEQGISKSLEEDVISRLEKWASEVDGIVISDFVYGVVSSNVLKAVNRVAQKYELPLFGDVQCSSQIGNILKLRGFNLICPTEREARIALASRDDGLEWLANTLLKKTKAAHLLMKLGADGFIAYGQAEANGTGTRQPFPALVSNPVDQAGAGDAVLATMASAMVSGVDLLGASAIATCVAALAVRTVGNLPVKLSALEQFVHDESL